MPDGGSNTAPPGWGPTSPRATSRLEAGLDDLVSYDKGCFLGQEAVAKVRNLGRPRRVLLRLRSHETVAPGEPVVLDGDEIGAVTSAASDGDGTILFARVAWEARAGALSTAAGAHLRPV